jgi:hypothetical protein
MVCGGAEAVPGSLRVHWAASRELHFEEGSGRRLENTAVQR